MQVDAARRTARRAVERQQEAWFAALKPAAQQRLMLEFAALQAGQPLAPDRSSDSNSAAVQLRGSTTGAPAGVPSAASAEQQQAAAKLAALRDAEAAVHADAAQLWVRCSHKAGMRWLVRQSVFSDAQ